MLFQLHIHLLSVVFLPHNAVRLLELRGMLFRLHFRTDHYLTVLRYMSASYFISSLQGMSNFVDHFMLPLKGFIVHKDLMKEL